MVSIIIGQACAVATDYNQDLKCEVLSLCTPVHVTFLLFMVLSVLVQNVYLSCSKTALSTIFFFVNFSNNN